MKTILGMAVLAILFQGCSDDGPAGVAPDKSEHYRHPDSAVAGQETHAKSGLSHLSFISDRDTSCGMPLSAGLTDTLLHAGQILGFCSPACKQQFAALVTKASGTGRNEQANN